MGTGDVEEALRKGEGPLFLEKDKGLETQTPMPGITLATPGCSSINVAGRKASAVVLGFWQGGFYLVTIVLSAGDKDPGTVEWFKEASRLLTPKYGAPGPCGKEECNWKKVDAALAPKRSWTFAYPSAPLTAAAGRGIPAPFAGAQRSTADACCSGCRQPWRPPMAIETILIVVLVVFLLGGGGFYWSRR